VNQRAVFTFVKGIFPLNHKKIFVVVDVLRVQTVDKTFGKRKVMNRIENISLATTVAPCEAIDRVLKTKISVFVIAKIDNLKLI
jgi:hypothetical protein